MGELGISAFVGLGQTCRENLAYLERARRHGYTKLFTSLHVPEADPTGFRCEMETLLAAANDRGFEVTADVSPRYFENIELAGTTPASLGIHVLRLDFGFDPVSAAEIARHSGCRIELNASTATEQELNGLLFQGVAIERLRAGHNYYPRPETGLGFALFAQRSALFRARGIPVSAFVPCLKNPRGPVFCGLPTLEAHRRVSPASAVRQLWASQMVRTIFFGDPLVPEEVLEAAAAQPEADSDVLTFRVVPDPFASVADIALMAEVHVNRADAAQNVVRSAGSRQLGKGPVTPQREPQQRPRGSVTVDNLLYGRYMGELQIALVDLPPDERVNVAGRIVEEDLCLLDCLTPGRPFAFREVNAK